VRIDFAVLLVDEGNDSPSSTVLWSIGHFMVFFVFRFVRTSPLMSGCFIDHEPWVDVYGYNFPDDRRALKFLGEYSTFLDGFEH
jgi:hypothetical protein